LFIDHVIHLDMRSGPRRPFIVNLSPYGSALRLKGLSNGPLYGPSLLLKHLYPYEDPLNPYW